MRSPSNIGSDKFVNTKLVETILERVELSMLERVVGSYADAIASLASPVHPKYPVFSHRYAKAGTSVKLRMKVSGKFSLLEIVIDF